MRRSYKINSYSAQDDASDADIPYQNSPLQLSDKNSRRPEKIRTRSFEPEPYKMLAAAVLIQAIRDIRGESWVEGESIVVRQIRAREAKEWIQSEACRFMLHSLDVPDNLFDRFVYFSHPSKAQAASLYRHFFDKD